MTTQIISIRAFGPHHVEASRRLLRAARRIGGYVILVLGLWAAVVGGSILMGEASRVGDEVDRAAQLAGDPPVLLQCLAQGCS